MMKHFIIFLALLIAQWASAQDSENLKKQILEDIKISLELGSIEDLEVLDSDDLESLFDYAKPDQPIELKIICNFEYEVEDITISGTAMTITGNTREMDEFHVKTRQAKSAIKEIYKTKD